MTLTGNERETMTLSDGTILSERYRVISTLGQGGMGAVYCAEDEHLNTTVAVKENMFLSDGYSKQFHREAKILASLRHPALPRVGDYFVIPNQGQYLVMEFIEGEDLRQRIERLGTIPEVEAVIIGLVICDALKYLHNRPQTVIHRDIKPGNIKITPEGEIVLVDFGLAKVIESDDGENNQDTMTGARAMTPGYSPPEQYGTARTDARSDIYSLGATLYAALTGIIPEDGLSRATGNITLTPIRELNHQIGSRLAGVIEKALEINPDNRYQEAGEFRNALITAGELTVNTLERLTVSPPPNNDLLENGLNSQNNSENSHKLTRKIKPKKPAHTKKNPFLVYAISILVFVSVGFACLFYTNYQILAIFPALLNAFSPTQAAVLNPVETGIPLPAITNHNILKESPLPPNQPTKSLPALSLSTQAVTPAEPTIIPGNHIQRIAFVSNRTGNNQIWTMNPDGSDQVQLTSIEDGVCQPSFSADGKKLAVISPCQEKKITYDNTQILILNVDGSDPQPLPVNSRTGFDPAWSHDGSKLAFSSVQDEDKIPHIFSYDFTKNAIEELSDTRYADINPAWNTGDKQLAFSRLGKPAYHIWAMSDKGVTQFQLSSSGEINDYFVDWSHDGEFMIFSRAPMDTNVPYLYRLDYADRAAGGETRILPQDKRSIPVYRARLSADDQQIVFESWPDGRNHDIFMMDIDGDNFVRLTNDPDYDFDPVWIPTINGG